MKTPGLHPLEKEESACKPFPGKAPCQSTAPAEPLGWWDVHTHRSDADMRYAIRSCQSADGLPGGALFSAIPGEPSDDMISCRVPKSVSSSAASPELPVLSPLYLSVGIHPWYLTEENFSVQWEALLAALRDKRVVAIGEAGLDKHAAVSFGWQCAVFRKVIALADKQNLPLIIHAVKASNEIVRLKKELNPRNPWIIHGFRGKKELAQTYLRQGIYLSFGERYQEEALRATPVERLFLETDESPADIRLLYGRAAKILEIPEADLRKKVEENINKLFFRQ